MFKSTFIWLIQISALMLIMLKLRNHITFWQMRTRRSGVGWLDLLPCIKTYAQNSVHITKWVWICKYLVQHIVLSTSKLSPRGVMKSKSCLRTVPSPKTSRKPGASMLAGWYSKELRCWCPMRSEGQRWNSPQPSPACFSSCNTAKFGSLNLRGG